MKAKKMKLQCLSGVVKSAQDGAVYIEGYANRKVIDRSDEIIESDAWALEDYKKNPVILYNHGMDAKLGQTPVGKCEKIEPRDDGLYIKAKVSSVDDPDIKRVRELVKEGMLRAFSVGFSCKDSIMDEKGIRRIKKADLFEISIVGVPMNQDSLFSISGKMLSTKSIDQIGEKICEKKGALAASAVHGKMYDKLKDGTIEREALLSKIADEAEVDIEDLKPILSGDVSPIPDNILSAFSSVLEMPIDELKSMNIVVQADEPEEAEEMEEEEKEEEEKEEDYEEEKQFKELAKYSGIDFQPPEGVAEAAKRGLEMREKYGRGGTEVGVARARDLSNRKNVSSLTIKRMVSFFARHEENKDTKPEDGNGQIAWLLWGGDPGKTWSEKVYGQMEKADEQEKTASEDKPEEKEPEQKPAEEMPKPEKEPESTKAEDDFQACVSSKIPKLLKEGMEQDQAVATAISMCQEKQKDKCQVSNSDYERFFDIAAQSIANEIVEKQAEQESVSPVTTTIAAAKSDAENADYGNPMLEAQKQTNVFLGQLIGEIQKMSAKLDAMQGAKPKEEPKPEPQPEAAPPQESENDEEKEKAAIDLFNQRLENCMKRLKALGAE